MILYTSGTTSRPKGVVTTHASITAQIESLIVKHWEWSVADRTLLCLPLHHVHGIINVVSCALWSGAACEMLPRFDAAAVWDRIASEALTLFMAVPTIYVRLITAYDQATPVHRPGKTGLKPLLRRTSTPCMVSGSAALPVSTLERWREISGHTLLERYGMTEIGMALSYPLHGKRVPGSVGRSLPGVEVKLVNENGEPIPPATPGEIEKYRGPNVFQRMLAAVDRLAAADPRGLPRRLVSNLATPPSSKIASIASSAAPASTSSRPACHKVSRSHRGSKKTLPASALAIAECAVVGVPDAEWGERIAAAVVLNPKAPPSTSPDAPHLGPRNTSLPTSCPRASSYSRSLPRNAMGKVVKPKVTALLPPPPMSKLQDAPPPAPTQTLQPYGESPSPTSS